MTYQSTNRSLTVRPPAEIFLSPEEGLRRNLRTGMIVLGLLVFTLFILAAVVRVRGAVIAGGHVAVESQVKEVAHREGGIVAEIYVRDGQHVRAGDPLVRLESSVAGISATVSREGFDQLKAQRARLEAERDGRPAPDFPVDLLNTQNASARRAVDEQLGLFQIRREARMGTQAQLRERVSQLEQQIQGFQAQIDANRRQMALIQPELEGVRRLWEQRLVTINRLNQLERTAVEFEGTNASLAANIAQARARITETREQALQAEQEARSQAGTELNEIDVRLADQQVRRASTGETYARSLITAPSSGYVNELAVSTVGGVIRPAETIMKIVPDQDRLTVEAEVNPADIDQLRLQQPVVLRFSTRNAQSTPEIAGILEHISADTSVDEQTGAHFYRVRIGVPDRELRRLGGLQLVPGMNVETHIQTNSRSLLSYILKPLRDQLNRAFREG